MKIGQPKLSEKKSGEWVKEVGWLLQAITGSHTHNRRLRVETERNGEPERPEDLASSCQRFCQAFVANDVVIFETIGYNGPIVAGGSTPEPIKAVRQIVIDRTK